MIIEPPITQRVNAACRPIFRTRRQRLWTPRRPETLNAGNLVQIGSDNKIRIGSDNKIKIAGASDACCCPTFGTPCNFCAGNTPANLTVTLSGLTLCTCVNHDTGKSCKVVGDPDITYTVPQVNSCQWRVAISAGDLLFYEWDSSTTCTGVESRTKTLYIQISRGLGFSGGSWVAQVDWTNFGSPSQAVFASSGTGVETATCFDLATLPNGNAACGDASHPTATGGSMAISA